MGISKRLLVVALLGANLFGENCLGAPLDGSNQGVNQSDSQLNTSDQFLNSQKGGQNQSSDAISNDLDAQDGSLSTADQNEQVSNNSGQEGVSDSDSLFQDNQEQGQNQTSNSFLNGNSSSDGNQFSSTDGNTGVNNTNEQGEGAGGNQTVASNLAWTEIPKTANDTSGWPPLTPKAASQFRAGLFAFGGTLPPEKSNNSSPVYVNKTIRAGAYEMFLDFMEQRSTNVSDEAFASNAKNGTLFDLPLGEYFLVPGSTGDQELRVAYRDLFGDHLGNLFKPTAAFNESSLARRTTGIFQLLGRNLTQFSYQLRPIGGVDSTNTLSDTESGQNATDLNGSGQTQSLSSETQNAGGFNARRKDISDPTGSTSKQLQSSERSNMASGQGQSDLNNDMSESGSSQTGGNFSDDQADGANFGGTQSNGGNSQGEVGGNFSNGQTDSDTQTSNFGSNQGSEAQTTEGDQNSFGNQSNGLSNKNQSVQGDDSLSEGTQSRRTSAQDQTGATNNSNMSNE